jgi:hypothetical protein
MSTRITAANLQAVVDRINRLTGSPATSYTRGEDGKLRANVGNFHISSAYGGVTLHRMSNEAGGVTTPLGLGYSTKRDLYEQLHAFARGIEMAQEGIA